MMNLNNFGSMPNNQNNNNNLNNNTMLMNLLNQNNQMANNIAMNNEMIKNILNSMKNEMEKKFLNIDLFPSDNKENMMNVIFEGDDGTKINIVSPKDVKMKELLKIFYIKLQIYSLINEKSIKKLKDYFFIVRGSIISLDDQRSAADFGLIDDLNRIIYRQRDNIVGG